MLTTTNTRRNRRRRKRNNTGDKAVNKTTIVANNTTVTGNKDDEMHSVVDDTYIARPQFIGSKYYKGKILLSGKNLEQNVLQNISSLNKNKPAVCLSNNKQKKAKKLASLFVVKDHNDSCKLNLTEIAKFLLNENESPIDFARYVISTLPFVLVQKLYKRLVDISCNPKKYRNDDQVQVSTEKMTYYGINIAFWKVVVNCEVVNQSLLLQETEIKHKWLAEDSNEHFKADEAQSLVQPVFNNNSGLVDSRFSRTKLNICHPTLQTAITSFTKQTNNGSKMVDEHTNDKFRASTVQSFSRFKRNLEAFSNGILKNVQFNDKIFLGGSSVYASLLPYSGTYKLHEEIDALEAAVYQHLPLPPELIAKVLHYATHDLKSALFKKASAFCSNKNRNPFWDADLDIFFCADSMEEMLKNVRSVANIISHNLSKNNVAHSFFRTSNAITILGEHPYRHVQLIMLNYKSVAELLSFCDLDCTAFVYTGDNVKTAPRGIRAINTRCNFVSPALLRTTTLHSDSDSNRYNDFPRLNEAQLRIVKYLHRGVSAVTFDVCKHQPRCDVRLAPDAEHTWNNIAGVYCTNYTQAQLVQNTSLLAEHIDGLSSDEQQQFNTYQLYERIFYMYGKSITHLDTALVLQSKQDLRLKRLKLIGIEGKYKWLFGDKVDDVLLERLKENVDPITAVGARQISDNDARFARASLAPQYFRTMAVPFNYFALKCAKLNWANIDIQLARPKQQELLTTKSHSWLKPECYMCAKRYSSSALRDDHFGSKTIPICDECYTLNKLKREETVDMTGKKCIVTGGRIKIGYAIALKLLRCNATVLVTTRFPRDAANRFSQEVDFANWHSNLSIYGLDLRSVSAVEKFVEHVKQSFANRDDGGVDVLINNAAQTIRRPPSYYRNVFEKEKRLEQCAHQQRLDYNESKLVKVVDSTDVVHLEDNFNEIKNLSLLTYHKAPILAISSSPSTAEANNHHLALLSNGVCSKSSLLPMIPLLESDIIAPETEAALFPTGVADEHGEQLDLRADTSWNSTIQQVSATEMMEVQMVNQIAPFTMISALTELMGNNRTLVDKNGNKMSIELDDTVNPYNSFIVNVTSTEGQFSATKYNGSHPHSNMSKAALNMMTRSIAGEMRKKFIFVSSVDTGWVSQMLPNGNTTKVDVNNDGVATITQHSHQAVAPLSCEDGAARVLDPIIQGIKGNTLYADVLLRNFAAASW